MNPFVPKGTVYRDDEEKIQLESRNGVIQFEFVFYTVENWAGRKFTPELLLELQRLAVNQIYRCAGHFRDGLVILEGADHKPPSHELVPGLVNEMCAYVNDHWDLPPVHLASYVMWKLNWIHPFTDGNGRTSRGTSHMVLCVRLGLLLPGRLTIPDQITQDKTPYYKALEAADVAWSAGKIDLSEMKQLLSSMLATQLLAVHEAPREGEG